jgi:hypothetical protein
MVRVKVRVRIIIGYNNHTCEMFTRPAHSLDILVVTLETIEKVLDVAAQVEGVFARSLLTFDAQISSRNLVER